MTVLTPENSMTWAVARTEALKLNVTLVTAVAFGAHLMELAPTPDAPAVQPLPGGGRGGDPPRFRGAEPRALLLLKETLQAGIGLEGHHHVGKRQRAEDAAEVLARRRLEHEPADVHQR